MKYLNKSIDSILNFRKNRSYNRLLPTNHFNEDIFLVSYPKSGNTWLRFLICNAIKCQYEITREVNFFSIHEFIPDIHISRNLHPRGIYGRSDLPRIIKSHSSFNPYYARVILLLRNPTDVLISHYYYCISNKYISKNTKLVDFLRSKKYGIDNWVFHTNSWLQSRKTGHIVKIFFYEKFKQNTDRELKEIMELLGIKINGDAINKAIQLSNLDNMKISEQRHMSTQIIKYQTIPFVRKAGINYKEELELKEQQYIDDATTDIREKLDTGAIWM